MKLNEILKTYKDIIIQYKDASDLEKAILALRNNSYSYAEIQKALGNPSKKFIRQVLLKYDPELIDIDTNFHKLAKQKRISIEEGEFRYRLIQTNIWKWNLQGEDYEFYIKDNELFFDVYCPDKDYSMYKLPKTYDSVRDFLLDFDNCIIK